MGVKKKKNRRKKNHRMFAHQDGLYHLHKRRIETEGTKECFLTQSSENIAKDELVPPAADKQNREEQLVETKWHVGEENALFPHISTNSLPKVGKSKSDEVANLKEAVESSCLENGDNKMILKANFLNRKRVDFVYPVSQENRSHDRLFFFPKPQEYGYNSTDEETSKFSEAQDNGDEKGTSLIGHIEIHKETEKMNELTKISSKKLIPWLEENENKKQYSAREVSPIQELMNPCSKNVLHAESQPSISHLTRQDQPFSLMGSLQLTYGATSVKDAVRDESGNRPRANSTDVELKLPQRGLCEERAVLATHCWRSDLRTTRGWLLTKLSQSRTPGMQNLGNTCFLNATLQCLAYLPTFCQCITSLSISSSSKIESNGQKIILMMRSLMRRIHSLDAEGGDITSTISPRGLVSVLPTLGGTKRRFKLGRQEDAHEFLVYLLDAMKDGELIEAGINPLKIGWRDRLPIPRLDETTLIHRMFGGYFRSQVRCTNCEYKSNTYDPFLGLSLEVSKGDINSLSSAIGYFTRKEKLDARNQWKCSGCQQYVCATKQFTVFRPPLTLCIQLKRFAYGVLSHPFGSSRNSGQKICKPIQFPASLSLPLSDKRQCEYDLTGLIVHVGGSSNAGHYMAYIKKLIHEDKATKSQTYQWYFLDDSAVHAVPESQVLRQSNAYVLFYCRKEVKLEFPTPPSKSNMSAAEASEAGKVRARARGDSFASIGCPSITTSSSLGQTASSASSLQQPGCHVSGSVSANFCELRNSTHQVTNLRSQLMEEENAIPPCKKFTHSFSQGKKFGLEAFEKWTNTGLENNGTIIREDDRREIFTRTEQEWERKRVQSMSLSKWESALDEGKVKKKKKMSGADGDSNFMPNLFNLAQNKKSRVTGRGQGNSVLPVLNNRSTKRKRQRIVTNHQNGRFGKRKHDTKRSQKWKNNH